MGCSLGVDPMDRPDPSPTAPDHLVQFYDEDAALIATLAEYIGIGLATDRNCLVIATKDHRDALDERLRDAGLDLSTAQATGQYVAVDAADTLARIEVGGGADPQRFMEVVGTLFGRLRPGRPIRVFGEMVGLLLTRGRSDATLRLEDALERARRDPRLRAPVRVPPGPARGPRARPPDRGDLRPALAGDPGGATLRARRARTSGSGPSCPYSVRPRRCRRRSPSAARSSPRCAP